MKRGLNASTKSFEPGPTGSKLFALVELSVCQRTSLACDSDICEKNRFYG